MGIEPNDIRSLEDIKLLPILQKDEIRNDHKRFLSEETHTPVFKVSTSGSTGIPMEFYISQSAAATANICRIRALEWWGIKLGDRELRFWGIGYLTFEMSLLGSLKRLNFRTTNQFQF